MEISLTWKYHYHANAIKMEFSLTWKHHFNEIVTKIKKSLNLNITKIKM